MERTEGLRMTIPALRGDGQDYNVDILDAICNTGVVGDVNLRKMPDQLIRRAKAQAALRGMSLKQLVIETLEKALKETDVSPSKARGKVSRK